jgi:hypothetical protein
MKEDLGPLLVILLLVLVHDLETGAETATDTASVPVPAPAPATGTMGVDDHSQGVLASSRGIRLFRGGSPWPEALHDGLGL